MKEVYSIKTAPFLSFLCHKGRGETRAQAAVFRVKAAAHQTRRAVFDVKNKVRRHETIGDDIKYSMLHAQSRTPLWGDETIAEHALQLGKVQNLRVAARRLNGALLPREALFSFWKQVGRATKKRGFAEGRLLREGCLMTAVGGGLCQLSNALYDVALQAGCEIVERHAHSQIVAGSQAANGRDATVAWNYIDLRFRSPHDLLLKVALSRDELLVQLWSKAPKSHVEERFVPSNSLRILVDAAARSCVSCEQSACFRHREAPSIAHAKIALLLDERWPEWEKYVKDFRIAELLVPLRAESFPGKRAPRSWQTTGFSRVSEAPIPALQRAFWARRFRRAGARRLQAQWKNTAKIARVLGKRIAPDVTHLVIAQSYLPFLWRDGFLGGRTFDVLMTHLPLHELQHRLDEQSALHPERATLRDFRVAKYLVQAENEALKSARQLISPHHEIAALYGDRVLDVSWESPAQVKKDIERQRAVAFPGPTAARKGAYELREACRVLGLEVWLLGSELEGGDFWRGLKTRRIAPHQNDEWMHHVGVVAQPALTEEQPRLLLQALGCGAPVIATAACGLANRSDVQTVPFGDVEALQNVLRMALKIP